MPKDINPLSAGQEYVGRRVVLLGGLEDVVWRVLSRNVASLTYRSEHTGKVYTIRTVDLVRHINDGHVRVL